MWGVWLPPECRVSKFLCSRTQRRRPEKLFRHSVRQALNFALESFCEDFHKARAPRPLFPPKPSQVTESSSIKRLEPGVVHNGRLSSQRVPCGLRGSFSKITSTFLAKPLQIFKVVMQADTVGNRLKEVQTKAQDLAHFGLFYLPLAYPPN